METLFKDPPLRSAQFFDSSGKEIAYVVLEENTGIGWSILASTADGNSIMSDVAIDMIHEDPRRYAEEQFTSARDMVRQLISFGGKPYTGKEGQ